ncbi:DNA repair protein recA homolog 3, mitochondrial-like isoform X1 [Rhododendron vialii]|uniref:DNA repair protein recA homolog 3, mitochondrial-like isoform X1 n=1 Tax=Rhododendron vialii TaxID=182163 RepID=UPI00265D8C93|nr:DNA repair protein recA homolog 3, mitochondrial-like isoform X1 [Rhododendron vialii]
MARLLRSASSLKRYLCNPQGCRKGLLVPPSNICSFSTKGRGKSKSEGSDSNKENLSTKELALQQALDQITTSFGKGSIMWLGRSVSPRQVPVVSTGSFSLDMALGIGGLPKGRVVEIYGPEASGKTTLALHVIAEAQKQGGLVWDSLLLPFLVLMPLSMCYCVFVDAEHALDPTLAEAIGVNTENLLLSQPDCGEQALSLVDTLIRSGSVDVVVVDSVAALVPKGELDGEMGDAHMAMQARLMSQALRKLSHSLSLSQTILIFVNQVRSKLSTFGGFGGSTEVTCGGNALKFYASVRLNIRRTGLVKKGEETTGSQVLVKIVKNKHAPPFKTAQFELEFGKGISRESEIIELGCKHKFITKIGGAYYSMNEQSFHGKDAIKQYLIGNPNAREELIMKLREKLLDSETDRENDSETESLEGTPSQEIIPSDSTDEEVISAVEA